jgi:hypothetical protein
MSARGPRLRKCSNQFAGPRPSSLAWRSMPPPTARGRHAAAIGRLLSYRHLLYRAQHRSDAALIPLFSTFSVLLDDLANRRGWFERRARRWFTTRSFDRRTDGLLRGAASSRAGLNSGSPPNSGELPPATPSAALA